MTSIHDQAMNNVYQQVLHRLLGFFSRAERTALQLLIQRLAVAAGGMENIGDFKVLAIQTGTRDNCYSLALLRAAQLTIATRSPTTFKLRIASLRLNGNSTTALENMHRTNSALFIYDDLRVEVLMVDDREVLPFNHQAPNSNAGTESNRLNLLLLGHRRHYSEALDAGRSGYLATGEFYGQIARWEGGVDALLSNETPRQQKQFIDGLNRAAMTAGLDLPDIGEFANTGLFTLLDELGSDSYREFYADQDRAQWRPAERFETCRRATCIDIHDMLVSPAEERWPLLNEFLGFQPDAPSAQIRDNEFVSLAVAAHLCGLQACLQQGRSYEAVVVEHLKRALVMMRRKQLPDQMCEQLIEAFGNPATLAQQRQRTTADAHRILGLNEAQLVCLLFAPFIDKGAGLERFLRLCHPGMLVAMPDLHRAMQGHPVAEQIMQWMVEVSGLPVSLIGRLYRMELVPDIPGERTETASDGADSPEAGIAMADEWSVGR